MNKIHSKGGWLIALILASPAVVKAVAVPPELLQQETPAPIPIDLYAFMIGVFIIGVLIGIWVQRKLT